MSIETFTNDLKNNFKDWQQESGSIETAESLSNIMRRRHRKVDKRVIRKYCYQLVGCENPKK